MSFILSLILKFVASGSVDKVMRYLEVKSAQKTGLEKIRGDITIEEIRAAVETRRIMAGLQKSKFDHLPYWIFAGLFVVPLGFWWTAVILDSVFLFGWQVASVPVLERWGGDMIRWIFYSGGLVTAVRMLR